MLGELECDDLVSLVYVSFSPLKLLDHKLTPHQDIHQQLEANRDGQRPFPSYSARSKMVVHTVQ
jgi:hypothetical protein